MALPVVAGDSSETTEASTSSGSGNGSDDYASIRVLSKPVEDVDIHDHHHVEEDHSASFWDDLVNFTPGALPRVTTIAVTIGVVCGIVAYLYYASLFFLLRFLWKDLPQWLFVDDNFFIEIPESLYWLWIPLVGYTCAVLVGLSVRFLGEPGDLSYTVQCVRDEGYIKMNHVLPMVAASQFSILGGGSLGPEAPLVAVCAAFGGLIGRKGFGTERLDLVRKHTLMGMSCALAAFFGVPLGGSLFALEINNRFGIEYYEHTMDAIFSGTVCLVVFRGLAGLDIGPVWDLSSEEGAGMLPPSKPLTVGVGALLGLCGAGVAALFVEFHKHVIGFFRKRKLMDNRFAVQRALLGATGVIVIGVLVPQTLFWGELEIETIAAAAPASELPNVFPTSGLLGFEVNSFWSAFTVGVLKMVSISFTVAAGYRGGFIFPFFLAGTAFGKALTYVFPSLSPTLAVLCFAAGINVAITRTALASTLILCGLAGEINAGPPVLAASMISLFATKYMPFIRSQSSRRDIVRKKSKPVKGAKWLSESITGLNPAKSFGESVGGEESTADQLTPLVEEGTKSYNT